MIEYRRFLQLLLELELYAKVWYLFALCVTTHLIYAQKTISKQSNEIDTTIIKALIQANEESKLQIKDLNKLELKMAMPNCKPKGTESLVN